MRRSKNGCDCEAIHEEVVDKVKDNLPSQEKVIHIAGFFSVFGDRTRIKILLALEQSEMCVCDLAVLLDLTKSVISHQLSSLKKHNLVVCHKEGKHNYYALADDHIRHIIEMATEHMQEDIKL
jgi:ArsR family transcriptional regulator